MEKQAFGIELQILFEHEKEKCLQVGKILEEETEKFERERKKRV